MFLQKQFLKKISSSYNFSTISVMSPYSLQPEFEVKVKKLKEANLQLENSQIAYNEWKKQPIDQRIKVCLRACDYFQENQQHIATQISTQMGKPIKQVIQFFDKFHFAQLFSKALEEVTKSIHRINVLCEMAPQALQDEIISNQNSGYMKIAKESLGVVLIISGWNNPLLSSINCLVSSILCGNTVIIKPSPFTPLSAKNFQDAFEYCGIQNIVQDCFVDIETTNQLMLNPLIKYIHFYGSFESGKTIYEEITQQRMVGIGMETGGNNPVYIREDVDIDAILPQIIKGTFQNSGQDLDSVGRIYVDQSRYNEFIEKSAEQIQQFKLGDPMNENTTLGPITLEQNLFELEKKVAAAVDHDARVILGGMITQDDQGKGQFFEPTLIVDCDNSMEIFQSINFGPIMALQQVQNDDEAISLMNDSMYGLSASVFTKNIELAQNVTKNLDYGIVNMNKCGQVNPHLVVSGRKNSGMGVQLGQMGFQNFLKPKSYNFKY